MTNVLISFVIAIICTYVVLLLIGEIFLHTKRFGTGTWWIDLLIALGIFVVIVLLEMFGFELYV